MAVRTRVRSSNTERSGGYDITYNCVDNKRTSIYNISTPIYSDAYANTLERTIDETHVPLRLKRPRGKQGGPFDHSIVTWENAVTNVMTIDAGCMSRWVGRFRCKDALDTTLVLPYDTWLAEVTAKGPEAWNRFRPGRPQASMGVFLGELRDLPGMLKQTCSILANAWRSLRRYGLDMSSGHAKALSRGGGDLGSKYLLYQFGWAPFLRDIKECYQTSLNIDRTLREIRANNGSVRRRGGTLLRTNDTTVTFNGPEWAAVRPVLSTPFYARQPNLRVTSTESRVIYFRGAFRYWIPDIGSLQWERNTRRILYGLTVNAEVIWNLIPWSWLIDWFANIGKNLASLDNGWADNLTAKYAYVLGTRSRTWNYYADVHFSDGQTLSHHSVKHYERKVRVNASPYGFGVTLDSLNPARLAILSALGYSRLGLKNFF